MAYVQKKYRSDNWNHRTEEEIRDQLRTDQMRRKQFETNKRGDNRYTSGPIKVFSKEEIAEYEAKYLPK